MAAAWKDKAEDNATKPLIFSLLMPLICAREKPWFLLPHKTCKPDKKKQKKKAALHEYLTQRKVRAAVIFTSSYRAGAAQ